MARSFGKHGNIENYGNGVVELEDPDEAAALDAHEGARQVAKLLKAAFTAPGFTPPVLPAAAMDVHRLAQANEVKLEHLLVTLEKDPLLAARVLKVASSTVYGGAPVHSLHSAVTRLGLKNLSTIVWEVALNMKVFRSKTYAGPMDVVRRHSVAVAHTARAIAKLTPVPLEYAFLCGLLHDVGAAAALLVLGDSGQTARDAPLSDDVLHAVLGQLHAGASQLVAKAWALPPDLQFVLGGHHTVRISGYPHPAASVVALAEKLVGDLGSSFGLSAPPWDTTTEAALMAAQQSLGIEQRTLDTLAPEILQTLQNLEHGS